MLHGPHHLLLRLTLAASFLFCSLPTQARAWRSQEESKESRWVVYDLVADDDLAPLAARLTDEMLIHLGKQPGLVVIGESELKVLVSHELDRVALMCEEQTSCLAQISQAAMANKVVSGHLGQLGDMLMVTLKLSDSERAVVERGETASAEQPAELSRELGKALDRLVGRRRQELEPASFRMEVAAAGSKAAVLDLGAADVSEGLARNMTQLLTLELKKFEGLGVISRDEIQTMLRYEKDKSILACTNDTSCLVEIGGALGVDYLVSGSIGRVGEAYVLTLKLMDIQAAQVVNRVSESFQGEEVQLPAVLRATAWALLGKETEGAGNLQILTNAEKGQLTLDGGKPRSFPLVGPLENVEAGKHRLVLTAEGFEPRSVEVFVEARRLTTMRLELQELPRPWYLKWWTWTIAAGTLSAGVTATLLLLPQEATTGEVNLTIRPEAAH